MEFEAETWWFCCTHEGYNTTKFQLLTPSPSAPTGNPFFTKCSDFYPFSQFAGLSWPQTASCEAEVVETITSPTLGRDALTLGDFSIWIRKPLCTIVSAGSGQPP